MSEEVRRLRAMVEILEKECDKLRARIEEQEREKKILRGERDRETRMRVEYEEFYGKMLHEVTPMRVFARAALDALCELGEESVPNFAELARLAWEADKVSMNLKLPQAALDALARERGEEEAGA